MKETSTKAYAFTAMGLSLISFGFMIASLIKVLTEPPAVFGVSRAFAYWLYGIVVATISTVFYFADGVVSAIKVYRKIDPVFNTFLSILLLGSLPMLIFVGFQTGICVYIWNAYCAVLFVLEFVSIVKHIKMSKAKTVEA